MENVSTDVLRSVASAILTMSDRLLKTFTAQSEDTRDWRLFRAHLMCEELGESIVEMANRDGTALLKELSDLIYVAYGTAVMFGLPVEDAFDEVHASNMTKDAGAVNDRSGKKGKGPNYRKADMAKVMAAHKERKTDGNGK